ncbi:hypothetical protein ABE871_13790 [Enterococcus gilvus]|uniref:hypothetical protein n=1 Tax=Enterococcus gilvus TaxID=160453 RepID=UPI003D6B449D
MERIGLLISVVSSVFILASCGDNKEQSVNSSEVSSSENDSSILKSSTTVEETQESSWNITSNSSTKLNDASEVDTKDLNTEQVKKWIAAIWIKRKNIDPFNDPKFEIVLENREDNLLYATVESTTQQIDTLDSFRISSEGFLEEAGYYQSMPDKEWIVVSKKYLDDSMVNEEAQTITSTEENTPSDHERAEVIRKLMEQNQGLYADVLASIPDNEILEATVGNVTNSQVAQTADNLIRKYPDLKP